MSVNYATFSGTITRDSIRQGVSTNGKAWAKFCISSGSSTYDKETGTYKKEPNFYCDCIAFGKLATTLEPVLQEGVSLLVSGHLTTEGYTRKDGTAGVNNHLTCENVAVNCVPWQTINVTVNNANTNTTGTTTQTQPQAPQATSNAWGNYQNPMPQQQMNNGWNINPMTTQQPLNGAAALGITDDPSF